jgi:O-antigen ligase
MNGVWVQPSAGRVWAAPCALESGDNAAASRILTAAVAAAAVVLPFLVVPAWYDAYYWPKVWLLYAAAAAGVVVLLRTQATRWLRDLGAPLGPALAGWLIALALATAQSTNPLLSVVGEDYRYEGLLTWLAYGAIAAVTASAFAVARRRRIVLGALAIAGAVMSAIGLLQHWGVSAVPADVTRRGWVRAWGTTGSPLALGAYIVLLIPVVVALYAAEGRGRRRAAYGALAVLLYAALLATEARGVWGALALGMVAWGVSAGTTALRRAAGALVLLGAFCAAVTPVVLMTGAPTALGHVADAGSAASRWFLWRTSAPLVVQRPLFGWGPDTLAHIYPAYGTPAFQRVFPEGVMQQIIVDRPHNDLLQQAISTGLVGLTAYLWLWTAILGTAWRDARVRRLDDREGRSVPDAAILGAGLVGAFVAYFAQLQLAFSFVSTAPVFWVLVGAAASLRGPAAGPLRSTTPQVRV